jgi:hypothetical protein
MNQQLANFEDIESDVETTDHLTKEMLIGALPDKRFRKNVTDVVVDIVNAEPNSELRRVFRDNTLSYASVLASGRYSLSGYVNAVKFVSYKMMGDKASTAYSKVFPDRYQNLVDSQATGSEIASFADNYGKTALVVKIIEQTIIPTHILNHGTYQLAINVQAELMMSAKSEMVRQKAAECLISNLVAPATSKIEIDVTHKDESIDQLTAAMRKLSGQQISSIINGNMTPKQIAHSDIRVKEDIVDAEFEDVEPGGEE